MCVYFLRCGRCFYRFRNIIGCRHHVIFSHCLLYDFPLFCTRYKLDKAKLTDAKPHELLEAVARKRGFLVSGGELDTERAAIIVLDEFRGAKIGRISLEKPPVTEKKPTEAPAEKEAEKPASENGPEESHD